MAVLQKCTFCGDTIAQGTGKLFIRKDAKMVWLCGNKCEKNLNKLGRKDRETRWTESYRHEKKARLAAIHHATQHTEAPAAKTTAAAKKAPKAKGKA